MNGQEVIDFIKDNKMEEKEVMAVVCQDGGCYAWHFDKISLSCPEDDSVFMELNLPDSKGKFNGRRTS